MTTTKTRTLSDGERETLAEIEQGARDAMREDAIDQSACPVCMGEGFGLVGPFNERLTCACCAGTGRLESDEE